LGLRNDIRGPRRTNTGTFLSPRCLSPVRRALFLLLIALLPFRAWVGDAMALQMVMPATGMVHTVTSAQTHGDGASHAMQGTDSHQHEADAGMADCADHSDAGVLALDTHCQTCTVCQACNSLAIALPSFQLDGLPRTASRPSMADLGYSSADRALSRKPPIS
jgi:hypothetical protein